MTKQFALELAPRGITCDAIAPGPVEGDMARIHPPDRVADYVYFKNQGRTIVVLLAGGDKRTQNRDIETALRLARNLQVDAMAKTVTSPYDVASHLRTPEEMAAYLEASIEEADGDAAFIAKALGDIARAKGMSQVACDAGLSRESLYKALSGERNPTLNTVLRVVGALGLKLRAEAVPEPDAAARRASAQR